MSCRTKASSVRSSACSSLGYGLASSSASLGAASYCNDLAGDRDRARGISLRGSAHQAFLFSRIHPINDSKLKSGYSSQFGPDSEDQSNRQRKPRKNSTRRTPGKSSFPCSPCVVLPWRQRSQGRTASSPFKSTLSSRLRPHNQSSIGIQV